MRRDHRPFWLKRAMRALSDGYAAQFVVPQFEALGEGWFFLKPQHLLVNGPHVRAGRNLHVSASRAHPVELTSWFSGQRLGFVALGDHVLISPGTRIISSIGITIGANTMIASDVYISDSDWHGLYDRTSEAGQAKPVVLEENVWLGVRAIVGKGVTIGRNSIVGAGAVVTKDVPPDSVVAGNPARVVKALDPAGPWRTRGDYLASPDLARQVEALDRMMLAPNSTPGWLRALLVPGKTD